MNKKQFRVEHTPTGGSIKVEIDFDYISNHGDYGKKTTDEVIKMQVDFWSGASARLEDNNGDYTKTFLKQLCERVMRLATENSYGVGGVVGYMKLTEGWAVLDGTDGITLLDVEMMELTEQDDYHVTQVSPSGKESTELKEG